MSCNLTREDLVAYLYDDDLSPEAREQCREHIAACPTCARLLEDLTTATRILDAWPEETTAPNMVFVEERREFIPGIVKRHPWRWTLGAAATLAAVLALTCLNVEFAYQNGVLHASVGLRAEETPRAVTPGEQTALTPSDSSDAYITRDEFFTYQREALALTERLIQDSEDRQRTDTNDALVHLIRTLDQQRRSDLKDVSHGIQVIYSNQKTYETLLQRALLQPPGAVDTGATGAVRPIGLH